MLVLNAVARTAALFIAGLGRIPTIGVSWGRTMTAVARQLPPSWNEGVEVILLNGAANFKSTGFHTNNVAELFAQTARGTATNLPVPAIVSHPATREALERDPAIARILAEAQKVDVACFGIGALSPDSVLIESGALTDIDVARLRAKGAVGDILGRFIDRNGDIVDAELDGRTIGVRPDSLRHGGLSIAVAAGRSKLEAIHGCLAAAYCNVLITDERTAIQLLELSEHE